MVFLYFRGFDGMYPGDFKLNAGIGACIGIKLLIPVIAISLILLVSIASIFFLYNQKPGDTDFLHKEVPYGCFSSLVTCAMLYFIIIHMA